MDGPTQPTNSFNAVRDVCRYNIEPALESIKTCCYHINWVGNDTGALLFIAIYEYLTQANSTWSRVISVCLCRMAVPTPLSTVMVKINW